MRKLALHASALSDIEYDFFTTSLREIIDDETEPNAEDSDTRFEQVSIGIREARAWIRGRYSRVSASSIDGILKLFSLNLRQGDSITGPEFFAALRLVIHAENGRDVDRSLAFVQVDSLLPSQLFPNESRSPSPPKRIRLYTDPSIAPSTATSPANVVPNNPFSLSTHPQTSSSQISGLTTPTLHHSSFNPFIHEIAYSDDGSSTKIPPLPPRKPPHQVMASPQPPPRRVATPLSPLERSISPAKRSTYTSSATPAIPPKPSQHVTSTLIKQSLQASKVAQTMKKAEEQLEKERVMQVLKSSSVVSGAYPLAGASVVGSSVVIGTNIHNQHQHQYPGPFPQISSSKPQRHFGCASVSSGSDGPSQGPPLLPKRRTTRTFPPPSQQPSPPASECSLEQVALASPQRERFRAEQTKSDHFNREDPTSHALPAPPPMHPDRIPNFGYQQLPSPDSRSPPPPLGNAKNLEAFEAIYGSLSLPETPTRSTNGTSTNRPDPPITQTPTTFITPSSPNSDGPVSGESPTTRASRSQSLTQPPFQSMLPPPPPIRRKRPESIQSFSTRSAGEATFNLDSSENGNLGTFSKRFGAGTSSGTDTLGHRRSSLSLSSTSSFTTHTPTSSPLMSEFRSHQQQPRRSSSGASSTVGGTPRTTTATASSTATVVGNNIQRTIEALQSFHGQLQPKLEKARYKAEAGISRRGYVRGSSLRASAEGDGGGGSSLGRRGGAPEAEEMEGLTRRHSQRGERWRDKFQVEEEEEETGYFSGKMMIVEGNGSDEDRRGRSQTVPLRLHPNFLEHDPRNVFDDSPG